MSTGNIEDRIKQLEQKVRQLEGVVRPEARATPWWNRVAGAFSQDPVYAEAMKLAHEEREAQGHEDSAT